MKNNHADWTQQTTVLLLFLLVRPPGSGKRQFPAPDLFSKSEIVSRMRRMECRSNGWVEAITLIHSVASGKAAPVRSKTFSVVAVGSLFGSQPKTVHIVRPSGFNYMKPNYEKRKKTKFYSMQETVHATTALICWWGGNRIEQNPLYRRGYWPLSRIPLHRNTNDWLEQLNIYLHYMLMKTITI